MIARATLAAQSPNPPDWAAYYAALQARGNVPDASGATFTGGSAIFRGLCLDLSVIQTALRKQNLQPLITVIYADVLLVPALTVWSLDSTGLVIYARRIEAADSATIFLDYRTTTSAQLVVFASEISGRLGLTAVPPGTAPPVLFSLTAANVAPGVSVNAQSGSPALQPLSLAQGIGFQGPDDMTLYLNNAFIYGSLLYDQNPLLALSIFLWVKGWAAQSAQFTDLFYRSTSLVGLLGAQINAKAGGAVFVPSLTSAVYTTLANAFATYAAKYEADYLQLSTQKVLTDQGIALAKTLVANADSDVAYAQALLQQANDNYANASASAARALVNFKNQQRAVSTVAAQFTDIGLPEYQRKEIIKGVFSLVTAVVTFGAGVAAMAMGDGAAAPAAAAGAIESAEAVASAADTTAAVAKTASSLAETMKQLKQLVELLGKAYELAEAVKSAAENISTAQDSVQVIQGMQDTTDQADLSAADGWAVYKIQADNLLQDPVDKGIGYAGAYKEAVDILVVYGQSRSAAQLAVIKTGQQAAAIRFQVYYADQKRAALQALVDSLTVGEAPILAMMQQFYRRYLDGKSSLFAALKSYQASYYYWALRDSAVHPQIVDPVSDLKAGIQDITAIAMDTSTALLRFNPPPQVMKNIDFACTDPAVLQSLPATGAATWVLPLADRDFAGLDRVRLSTVRVWLEGAVPDPKAGSSVYLVISTAGNYLDRYGGIDYQFGSKPLSRVFKYTVAPQSAPPDWRFDDGTRGFVQIDGAVDQEVNYAYFRPTPFAEWTVTLPASLNPGLDCSKVSKITMYFEGTAIGAVSP